LMNGMRVVTCELEEKFVSLSKENRELWREKFTGLLGFNADNWIILHGDSRRLSSVIGEAARSLSSPPYIETPVVSFTDDKQRTQEILAQLREKGFIEWEGKRYTEAEWRALNHGRIDGRTMKGATKGKAGYAEQSDG